MPKCCTQRSVGNLAEVGIKSLKIHSIGIYCTYSALKHISYSGYFSTESVAYPEFISWILVALLVVLYSNILPLSVLTFWKICALRFESCTS